MKALVFCFAVLALIVGAVFTYALHQDHECSARGGTMIRGTCVAKNAVIKL